MSERVQPGAEVPKETYEKFKTFVKNRHGTLRGNLGSALDRAMQDYMKTRDGAGPAERIEQDLATVNKNVAENRELLRELAQAVEGVEADGGAYTLSTAGTTHTHRSEPKSSQPNATTDETEDESEGDDSDGDENDAPDDPPHPKASRSRKAEWLAAQYDGAKEIACEKDLAAEVARVYSFGDDAAEALVEAAAERLEHVPHPNADGILVKPAEAERIRESLAEQARDDAAARSEELDAGHPHDKS